MNRREFLIAVGAGAAASAALSLAPGIVKAAAPVEPAPPISWGTLLYPRTVAEMELDANVLNYQYPPGDWRRYRSL